jgi:hypothetical protein
MEELLLKFAKELMKPHHVLGRPQKYAHSPVAVDKDFRKAMRYELLWNIIQILVRKFYVVRKFVYQTLDICDAYIEV